ncbi:MAG: hypothetical protein J6B93_04915 [Clostridia bacterium]|nr:hypothetical protein [Clostridia bacterium]
MKRMLSVVLSVVLVATSICIAVPAVAEASNTADALAATLGATEENLVKAQSFDTNGVTPYTLGAPYTSNIATNTVIDGKWVTQFRAGAQYLDAFYTNGWSDIALGDQIITFEFSSQNSWCSSGLYYRSAGTAKNDFNYRLTLSNGAGYKFTLTLESKDGTQRTEVTTNMQSQTGSGFKTYNVVLVSTATKDEVYMWEKGTARPTAPTLTLNTPAKTVKGNIFFETYNEKTYIDDIRIYDLSVSGAPEMSPATMEAVTGQDLVAATPTYKNNFNSAAASPVSLHTAYPGTSSIVAGQWQMKGSVGSLSGLTGKALGNFAAGFQVKVTDTTASWWYADFAYHSTTGWANLNNENRFNIYGSGDKLAFALTGKGGAKQNLVSTYTAGDTVNVVLTYIDKEIAAYIWKCGEAQPTAPTLCITSTEATSGDLHFHTEASTVTVDNFFVYENVVNITDNENLTKEDIQAVTGFTFADTDLVYSSNFAANKTAPVNLHTAYTGTSKIYRNKWVASGKIGSSTGLTGRTLNDFTLGFQFTLSDLTGTATYADFAYHSTTGWANLNNSNRLNMWVSGGKLAFGLSAKEGQQVSTTTDLVAGDKINVVLTATDNLIKAYIWKYGTTLPSYPTLKVMGTTETSGDIHFHLSDATFTMDDFFVFSNPDVAEDFDTTQKTLIDNKFDKAEDLLFAATDTGITAVEEGRFRFDTDGHKMLYSPLLAEGAIAKDFSWQVTYTPSEVTWNTDRFKFHCQGDTNSDSVYLEIIGSGNAADGDNIRLVRVLNNKALILASAKVDIRRLNSYNIRVISKDNDISVYWWKVGSTTPATPILTADAEEVVLSKGGFMMEGFHTVFFVDDMKLYNYAEGKQLTTNLPVLPENALLVNWDFNDMYGKTEFPFTAGSSLKYWQNTLQYQTPMKPERKQITSSNLIGDYQLSDLSWQFDVREFESWAVDKFVIHSADGTTNNSVYLLFFGNAAKKLQGGYFGEDSGNSALRLIQVINGKVTLLGTYDEEIARGKGYTVKITSKDNNIEVWFGAKRTGKVEKVISAKADAAVSSGQILIEGYNSNMWLDNVKIANCAEGSDKAYNKSLFATVE